MSTAWSKDETAESSTNQAWPEVHVGVAEHADADSQEQAVEQIEDWLQQAGALSVTLLDTDDAPAASGDAVLEPAPGELRLWKHVTVVGLFAQGLDPQTIAERLDAATAMVGLASAPAWRLSGLPDAVWEREWLRDFGPMRFGPRFQVVPTNHVIGPDEPACVTLRLDPGLAFGTGTHPTTALCLGCLGRGTDSSLRPLDGLDVIDYGSGSGILAIAALLLGADTVDAVDIDPQALVATRDNARLNDVSHGLRIGLPEMLDERLTSTAPFGCDLLLANILHGPLLDLGERFAGLVKPGGRLVLSGLLESQSASVRVRYNPWFEFEPDVTRDGWVAMSATRRS